jgi:hypothetical protein
MYRYDEQFLIVHAMVPLLEHEQTKSSLEWAMKFVPRVRFTEHQDTLSLRFDISKMTMKHASNVRELIEQHIVGFVRGELFAAWHKGMFR